MEQACNEASLFVPLFICSFVLIVSFVLVVSFVPLFFVLCSLFFYAPQRSAGVCTGASQKRVSSSSSLSSVIEQPAISSEVM